MSCWVTADGKWKVTTVSTADRGSWYQVKMRGRAGWVVWAEFTDPARLPEYLDISTLRQAD